jgi:hypothetical protein
MRETVKAIQVDVVSDRSPKISRIMRKVIPGQVNFQLTLKKFGLCLAKMSSKSKMARFALCLGLKREPELSQELL